MGSIYFTPSDKLQIANTADLRFGTGDFTVEWWQLATAKKGVTRVFSMTDWPNSTFAVELNASSNNMLLWINSASTSIATNAYRSKWVHFAITRSGSTIKVFQDGTQIGSSITSSYNFADTNPLVIGNQQTVADSTSFVGHIYGFHWVKGTALYTSNFNVPLEIKKVANTKLLLLANDSGTFLNDSSGLGNNATNTNTEYSSLAVSKPNGYETQIASLNPAIWYRFNDTGTPKNYGFINNTATVVGTPAIQQSPIDGTSAYLGGSSAYTLSDYTDYSLMNDRVFSVEFWFKVNYADRLATTYHNFYRQNGTLSFGLRLMGTDGSGGGTVGRMQMFLIPQGYGTSAFTSPSNYDDGNWHHCVYVGNGNVVQMYIDGTLQNQITGISSGSTFDSDDSSTTKAIGASDGNGEFMKGNIDEVAIYDSALTSAQITANYNAGRAATHMAYPSEIITSELVMPAIQLPVNLTYNAGALLANTATLVQPAVSLGINIDGGGVLTSSALFVDPVISVVSNMEYNHTVATASATSPNGVASASKTANYSASPATASALLSSNLFFGETNQDDTYEIAFRSITTSQNTASLNGTFDGTWNSGAITRTNYIAIKPISGFPAYNKIVKVKPNPATTYISNTNGGGRAEIYVFTADPNNSKTFTTMLPADFPAKELVYVQNVIDDGGLITLDLTPAFADSRAATYGILIQMHLYPDFTGTIPSNGTYRAEQWYSSSNQPQHEFLYVLSSDIINKNINADIITATALATDVTVTTEKYVDYAAAPSIASADIVHPEVGLSVSVDAMVATLSGLMPQPAFARTVEYPHAHAEAFGDIPNPQVFAFGTITYAAEPATASALMHMPQADIGENNIVDHMNASAVFVNPLVILDESVDAMVATVSGLMVQPATNTQLLGVVLAEPMRANAMSPNPPAYINLFGDEWYASLYAQHSVRVVGFPAGYSSAFLKLFEDQNADIAQSTPNTVIPGAPGGRTYRELVNNLTFGIVTNSGPENDASIVKCSVITDYSTPANESRLSVGYFDPYGRKAVRLQNIGIRMAQPLFHAKADFSLEFSIKTTKADQILSYAEWSSPTSAGRIRNTFNLVDGRLNHMLYSDTYLIQHPKQRYNNQQIYANSTSDLVTGYKQINDGQWHHVVVQYREGPEMDGGIAGRFQIWIDGELDVQRFGQRVYEPDFFGANLEASTYAPDFYTSAVSLDAPGFISERDIDLHYFDYIKYEPILAEPMTATVTHTDNNIGKGNRPRALMLYWWPTSSGQNQNLITRRFDSAAYSGSGEFDISMAPQELETIDYVTSPPQQYFGWDVFPVDINGYFVSDLVKEEAYGGAQNIVLNDLGGAVLAAYERGRPQFKANRRGYFRNTKDDTRRYIDLVKDIDLSQFDMIFFKNYPDQSAEREEFSTNQIVDPYFNIRETKIFEDFIKSLREAVDTGISLMVNNPQLALDLKIVDRIETVPSLQDTGYYYSDPYTPTIVPFSASALQVGGIGTSAQWYDTFKNNRIRVLNTFTDITDWKCNIHVRSAFFNNDDTLDFGAPSRQFEGYEHKPNGLDVGDEFFISTYNYGRSDNYLATPIANVKAGTPITAFANQYRQGLNLVNNPYKDHVTSIAIKPGDVLDGRQVKGKIWVNFTDPINRENETSYMDAIHTSWINLAYEEEAITLAQRDAYLASANLLENKLAAGTISQETYNREIQWQMNGMNILSQSQQIEFGDGQDDFSGTRQRKGSTRKTNQAGRTSAATTSFGGQWFTFTYARTYPQLAFEILSMNTRGLRWLSDRVAGVEQNQAHVAMPASATMVQPVIIGEKQVTINAQAMLASATKIPAVGYAGNDRNIVSLPLQATATMTGITKLVSAAPMTAAAVHRDSELRTTATDQIIVYVLHEDPILYLREDIIK